MDVQTTGHGQCYRGNTTRTVRMISPSRPHPRPAPSGEDLIKQVYPGLDRLLCGILFFMRFLSLLIILVCASLAEKKIKRERFDASSHCPFSLSQQPTEPQAHFRLLLLPSE